MQRFHEKHNHGYVQIIHNHRTTAGPNYVPITANNSLMLSIVPVTRPTEASKITRPFLTITQALGPPFSVP